MSEIPVGLCQCGCGQKTNLSVMNHAKRGWVKGQPVRFLDGHNRRLCKGKRQYTQTTGSMFEHRRVVEAAMGKPLASKHPVHHVNGIGRDNRHSNLVVCENAAYHSLLHRRQRALDACGHPGWLKCRTCDLWSPPTDLHGTRSGGFYHNRGKCPGTSSAAA